jgi:hypothetical protein
MDDKLLQEILTDYFKLSKELKKAKEDSDFWYKSWKALQKAIEDKDHESTRREAEPKEAE